MAKIAKSVWFQSFIIAVIVAAGVVVGIETYGEKISHIAGILQALDNTILFIFTAEVMINKNSGGRQQAPELFQRPPEHFQFLHCGCMLCGLCGSGDECIL